MAEELFRFMTTRPPQTTDAATIDLTTNSPFQRGLLAESGAQNWPQRVALATAFIDKGPFVLQTSSLKFMPGYESFRNAIEPVDPKVNRNTVDAAIAQAFQSKASALVKNADYKTDRVAVDDSILALFIAPRSAKARGPSLLPLVRIAQTMLLIEQVADASQTIDAAAVTAALKATLVLPPLIFPPKPNGLQPVGVADLLVVKQHLKRYELGEIAKIENLLRGESRKLSDKHTLTTEQTTVSETETTTETTKELQTEERFDLKRESENTVQEDISVKGGVSVTASYGSSVTVNANVDAAYSNSKTESTRNSTEYAKNVTSRAASKVTERVRRQVTTRVLETYEEDQDRSLDNTAKPDNVTGIYQWLNKVYEAQIFNYGQRLLFDVMVPEPAVLLVDAATNQSNNQMPKKPDDFTLGPSDLKYKNTDSDDANYYGQFLTRYNVEGVDAPPLDDIKVAKTFTLTPDDKGADKAAEVPIPDGYQAYNVHVDGEYNTNDKNNSGMAVWVGDASFTWLAQVPPAQQTPPHPQDVPLTNQLGGFLPFGIECWSVTDYTVVIEALCTPTVGAVAAWQLKTHAKILAGWQKQVQDYNEAVAKLKFQTATVGPLGSQNPDENRLIERRELKRSVIDLLIAGVQDPLGFNGIQTRQVTLPTTPPVTLNVPVPNAAVAEQQGAFIRFFEQAFEWENITYLFYPYFWGRKETWYANALLQNDDPLFAQFLSAGEARVVIPVRPSFQDDVTYFLITGQIWRGGDLPHITDSDYLPITEEIKAMTGAPEGEKPEGPPWEVRVPTSLIKLRSDGKLPGWTRSGGEPPLVTEGWDWTADPPDA